MTRILYPVDYKMTAFEPDERFAIAPLDWLVNYTTKYVALNFRWLLAHADDGLIWGKVEKDEDNQAQLSLSTDNFPHISPEFRAMTLQQLRLFGPKGELHLWRTSRITPAGKNERGFQARLLDETISEHKASYFDEAQILWGDRLGEQKNGYTLVAEGQGLRHAVPLDAPAEKFGTKQSSHRPLRLCIRHYLTWDDLGQTRICQSRLVDVYFV